jgi:hypothetical protein
VIRLPFLALVPALLLTTAPARALVVRGGGSRATDCLLVFDVAANSPPGRPHNIRCADGAPCDLDGEVNGSCQFAIAVCGNSTADSRCTLNGIQSVTVAHAEDNGDLRFDPEFQALQTRIDDKFDPPTTDADLCTIATNMHVKVRGPFANGRCAKSSKTVRIVTRSSAIAGTIYEDRDRIKLTCDPAPAGCSPTAFYSGTFDRIQHQVFNQSCAVSGCHDSQTQQAGMILETGASYDNLVGVTPSNPNVPPDWKRVLPGDSSRSFLFHKVTGTLAPGQGAPMPLGGPSLDPHLIDIIQLWIEAGAPKMGWVPGTDD